MQVLARIDLACVGRHSPCGCGCCLKPEVAPKEEACWKQPAMNFSTACGYIPSQQHLTSRPMQLLHVSTLWQASDVSEATGTSDPHFLAYNGAKFSYGDGPSFWGRDVAVVSAMLPAYLLLRWWGSWLQVCTLRALLERRDHALGDPLCAHAALAQGLLNL